MRVCRTSVCTYNITADLHKSSPFTVCATYRHGAVCVRRYRLRGEFLTHPRQSSYEETYYDVCASILVPPIITCVHLLLATAAHSVIIIFGYRVRARKSNEPKQSTFLAFSLLIW